MENHLKNAYPRLIFFLQYFEHTWFTTFPPNVYNVYACPPTLRTISTCEGYDNRFNVRMGKRVKPNFWIFFENSAKRRKTCKNQLFAIQTRIPQSSPKKKMARVERSNFQFKKSNRSRNLNIGDYWTNINHVSQNI